jgi:hypothetical protein
MNQFFPELPVKVTTGVSPTRYIGYVDIVSIFIYFSLVSLFSLLSVCPLFLSVSVCTRRPIYFIGIIE